eukprot:8708267-Pyramimonas_sp.AAC.1
MSSSCAVSEDPLRDATLADVADTELDELVTVTMLGDAGAEHACDLADLIVQIPALMLRCT